MHDHKKIEELQRENRALRRKIRMLEQQVSAVPEKPAETTGQYRAKNYFSYLLGCLREKSFFATAERAFKYFRNSLWVTRILKYGAIIYQYLQAGAFVLLYTAFFILIIPIFLAVTAVTLAIALILRKQNARSGFFRRPRRRSTNASQKTKILLKKTTASPRKATKMSLSWSFLHFSCEKTVTAHGRTCISAPEKRRTAYISCANISFFTCGADCKKAGNSRFKKQ